MKKGGRKKGGKEEGKKGRGREWKRERKKFFQNTKSIKITKITTMQLQMGQI